MDLKLNSGKTAAGITGGVLIPFFEFMYGNSPVVVLTMVVLLYFIVMDWISGTRASKKDNSYGSNYGIDGVIRTLFMLMLPAGGHLLDLMFNLPGVVFGVLSWGLIYHTVQSMTANCVRAGWGRWLPIGILNYISNWVKSELEAKISRAQQRVNSRERS